ncbi:DUF6578 domain-containing protein [Microbacterium oxydans]|nr:DUF6578 domain-containing protein [Microbacterium oxydans]
MTRVWLSRWEWACCGDPFAVGDRVDFGIWTRDPTSLVEMLGPELVVTVAALESHHEEEYADRVRGRVLAAYEVTHEVLERRFRYSPGLGARSNLRRESVRIEPVPGTTRLEQVVHVPSRVREGVEAVTRESSGEGEAHEERRRRVQSGWMVDVDVDVRQRQLDESAEGGSSEWA